MANTFFVSSFCWRYYVANWLDDTPSHRLLERSVWCDPKIWESSCCHCPWHDVVLFNHGRPSSCIGCPDLNHIGIFFEGQQNQSSLCFCDALCLYLWLYLFIYISWETLGNNRNISNKADDKIQHWRSSSVICLFSDDDDVFLSPAVGHCECRCIMR